MSNLRSDYTQSAHSEPTSTVAGDRPIVQRDRGTESKPGYRTTEFFVYVLAVIGVLVASFIAGGDGADGDFFDADQAWILVTALSIGYMLSRGLAKSGVRHRDA